MQQSLGRASQPTTPADEPDANATSDTHVGRHVRDVAPPVRYDDTALTDPSAERRSADPLDPHLPSRENGDPLDPDGHVL